MMRLIAVLCSITTTLVTGTHINFREVDEMLGWEGVALLETIKGDVEGKLKKLPSALTVKGATPS